jgi:glycine hydroxymethyltransferase
MKHLAAADPAIAKSIQSETQRQRSGLEMIASENYTSEAVLEALGSPLVNKYAEGYPGKRYYGGNQFIDEVETLAIERAKQLFGAEHANVQPHAGSQANLAAYLALANPGDTILAMNLAMGGHLTHGAAVNFSGRLFKFEHYGVRRDTGLIDLDEVRERARAVKPKIIVAGYTAYSRSLDFQAFRAIADEVGAYLLVDMAHFAGLVAARLYPDPIPYADVVTTTTHKTLRGPRGAMILCRREDRLHPEDQKNLARKIDSAVFPGMQGGPLENVIAAKAVAFHEALQPEFALYQATVIQNARALAETLIKGGADVLTGGTDNHMVLVDLTKLGIGGAAAEQALEAADIYVNKNLIPYDLRKPMDPSGLRLGTPALTTRGFTEADLRTVGELIINVLKAPESEAVRAETKKAVQALTTAHPIYEDLV